MSNRMDQLFKKKLGDHRLPPSAEAWSKIESGLLKKNNTVILWRAAAVFVLCGFLTGAWFYLQSTQDRSQQLAREQDDAIDTVPETEDPLIESVVKDDNKNQAAVIKKSTRTQREKITPPKNNEEVQEAAIMKEAETELIADLETLSKEPVAKAEKPIVIEFTLDPAPSTTLVAKATEVEKSNGFKKILDKALDLKNGEGDLGSLRDAKNELFALDFRKDKTKRN
ncbi:MAG: hypothetical protein ABL895_19205 [Cyclobacteriaceae bacterium]